jgi:hypothetical protein
MPVRRGHVAPKTTLIETIIRKFDTHSEYTLFFLLISTNNCQINRLFIGTNPKYN